LNIPFLSEARAVLDWTATPTVLTLYEWLKLEGISKDLFERELVLLEEEDDARQKGERQGRSAKFWGALIFILVIVIILFPLLLMSVARENSQPNPWHTGVVSVQLETFETLFKMDNLPRALNDAAFKSLKDNELLSGGYTHDDVALLDIANQSKSIWIISPGSRAAMTAALADASNGTMALDVNVQWQFSRNVPSNLVGVSENVLGRRSHSLRAEDAALFHRALINESGTPVLIPLPNLFPKYMRLGLAGSTGDGASALPKAAQTENVDCILEHRRDGGKEWWELYANHTGTGSPSNLEIITFSDEVIPPTLTFITNYGVVGLYVSVVLVVGRFLRSFVSMLPSRIPHENMPQVTTLRNLCAMIYRARSSQPPNLALEEELFLLLMAIYTSTEAMAAWSKTTITADVKQD